MKKILISILAATLLCSCNQPRTLRIVQYNVGVFSKELENSIPMISDMMKEVGADIISLNELDSCNLRHSNHQLADFAEAMGGWEYRYAKAFEYREGGYGVGVACKDAVTDYFVITLDKGAGSEYRACCVVETKDYVFASTHLDHRSSEAQLEQARTICSILCERYGDSSKPVFLCGDMNARPESETIMEFGKYFDLLSPTTDNTCPAKNPKVCIDYIYSLKNKAKVQVKDSKVMKEFQNGDVEVASDHLPVFAEVSF